MITSPILEEKYRVQEKLAEEAGYDVRKYTELCRKILAETEAEYGLKFKYGKREGGYLEPLIPSRLRDGYGCDVSDAG
uniref:Uncharacterized protein n=2 Tax=Candidatus Kentrum TaxID=2126330 RepID=A0A450V4P9_9GAMM|nr:MAG: hypothetical protein BECKH772A_GA0070896_101649 [Candidatus Kentron sp. H]VFJ99794.1 MAG: hypothetical protein BECKH772B_GA0070898_101689 [Candidatus Kentron sp. H]VFK04124.1 MAG: hypothetical protein BECKH772C_GA0070978_101629 [Candidatus Kentron sp. H]VFK42448.1 MAG: hypothetical protein BECKSD772F_GA0070984_112210 [Candidatus Kentron sp. SD]VFK48249.1 MAG: hypothetical protein BECKSD772E_GA0070983_111811 [Candidatus Kentron sp. SD]